VFFYELVKTEHSRSLTSEVLGQAFGIEPSHVRKICSKAEKKPKPPYRPPALNEDKTAAVVAFVENGHHTRNYVAQRDALSFIETNFQKCLSHQWMASFSKKHANLICRSVIRPQVNMRLKVSHDHLDQYIRLITEYVPLVLTELLLNIDGSGFSDWEERKPKCILIPTEAREMTLHYTVSRKIRHQTLVCCVTAAGDAYCPLLVSSNRAARAVFEHQFRDGIHLQIEISLLSDVNAEMFERHVDTVLIPAVEANQQLPGCDKTSHFVLRQLFSSHAEFNVREVSMAWCYCSHVPVAYVTYILSSGRIIIRSCQAIQKISNT
jgi:hypothetical protein